MTTLYSGTVTSVGVVGSAAYQVNDTGQNWTPGALEGAILKLTSGAAAGKGFRIRANTATQVEGSATVSGTVAVGDTFAIQTPGTVFEITGDLEFYGAISDHLNLMTFNAIKFRAAANNAIIQFASASAVLNGVDFDFSGYTGNGVQFLKCNAEAGSTPNSSSPDPLIDTTRAGVFVNGGRFIVYEHSFIYSTAFVMLRGGAAFDVGYGSLAFAQAIDAKGGTVTVNYGSTLALPGGGTSGHTYYTLSGSTDALGAIKVTNGSSLYVTGLTSITGSTGSAFYADADSMLSLTGTISGSGNGGVGVSVQHFSRGIVGTNVSVTGTGGNAKAGATVGTFASITGGTPLVEAASQTAIIKN
jgi:hypothetical protein